MSPPDAAKLLDLPADALPEQAEARFHELRARLEDKVAKAPTPGLKAKYRESLDEITRAFEVLTLAADSSTLPVLKREAGPASASSPAPRPAASAEPRAAARRGGREFIVVAIIAVLALAGGGWFVLQHRAAEAEKTRVAAEQKAEAERLAAEQSRRAEEEKYRAAAASKAEQAQLEQLSLKVRTRMSELNIALDALLRTEPAVERELSELKADERSVTREAKGSPTPDLRAAQAQTQAHTRYLAWLRDELAASPARSSRARLEELVSAKAWVEAAAALETYTTTLAQLQSAVAAKREELLMLNGSLAVSAEPAEVEFVLQDAYGRNRPGRTPAELADVPLGRATLTFRRNGWPDQTKSVTIARGQPATVAVDFVGGSLEIVANAPGVPFILEGSGRRTQGVTPATFPELPVGEHSVVFQREGWPEQRQAVAITRAQATKAAASYPAAGTIKVSSTPEGAEVWREGRQLGLTPLTLKEIAPGTQRYELRLAGFNPATLTAELAPGAELSLKGQLAKTVYTKQQGFERFWQAAAGTWTTTSGRFIQHLRITAGSDVIQIRIADAGSATYNYQLTAYDADNDGVVAKMTSFITRPTPLTLLRVKDGRLYWSLTDLSEITTFERLPDGQY